MGGWGAEATWERYGYDLVFSIGGGRECMLYLPKYFHKLYLLDFPSQFSKNAINFCFQGGNTIS